MSERTGKLFGILGATLFLSFAVLFILFGKEHWHVLALSIPCVYISWRFSSKYGSDTYFLMDVQQNLKLPARSICEPARKGDCLIFLLEEKGFHIWNHGNCITGQAMQKFEPLTPVIINGEGFVAWTRGYIAWFDFDGNLRSQFSVANQGISLLQSINKFVLVGTTDNSLFLWETPELSPISICEMTENCGVSWNGASANTSI